MARPKEGRPPGKYDPGKYAGSEGNFPYAEIPPRVPEKQFRAYSGLARKRFEGLAKRWNPTRNSEWTLRSYAALKHVMSATVALCAARDLPDEETPEPAAYPERVHDGVMGAARALAMLLPDAQWEDGALLDLPLRLLARLLRGSLAPMDANLARWAGDVLEQSAAYRYALGEEGQARTAAVEIVRLDVAIPAARFFCELAQWHSDVLAAALAEHAEPPIGYDFGMLIDAGQPDGEAGDALIGDGDARRIGELFGTAPYPDSLRVLAWERLAEEMDALWADASAGAEGVELDRALLYPFP